MTDLRSCDAVGVTHQWIQGVGQRGYCVLCDEPKPLDTSVDWDKPHEPGPVKIDVPGDQRRLAEHDAKMLGIGFLVDGKHVASSRVTVIERRHLEKHT